MLPGVDLLLVDCPDEAEFYLFGRQHQHHRSLRIAVISLDREERVLRKIATRHARAVQELTVNPGLASIFVQGRCRRLPDPLANLQQLLERTCTRVSFLFLPYVLFLNSEGMAHDFLRGIRARIRGTALSVPARPLITHRAILVPTFKRHRIPILIHIPQHLKGIQKLILIFIIFQSYRRFLLTRRNLNICPLRIRIVPAVFIFLIDPLLLRRQVLDQFLVHKAAIRLVDHLDELRHGEEAGVHAVLAGELAHPVVLEIFLGYRHALVQQFWEDFGLVVLREEAL